MRADTRVARIATATSALLFAACGVGRSPTGAGGLPYDMSTEEALRICANGATVSGIDISNNNGMNYDLRGAKAGGVRFVYLKASEGSGFVDWTYDHYRSEADKLKLIHGAYHFFRPEDDPNAQADNFLAVIGSAPKGDMPPALDWEVTDGVDWGTAFSRAKTFLDRVEKATGRTPIIYTYPDFFGTRAPDEFARYPLWISNPGSTCPLMPNGPWNDFAIFQFDTGGVDKDHFVGDMNKLLGFVDQTPPPPPLPTEPPPFSQVCNNAGVGNEGVLSGCNASAIRAIAPASAKAFLDRAFNWIDQGVPYSQTSETDGYRQDCSGFVSYVWQTGGPGDTSYSFAGGPWNNDVSVRIGWGQLTPGDALNFPGDFQAGTGHVELWGGWLDKQHTEYCSMEEFDWGNPASFRTHSIYEYWAEAGAYGDVKNIFLPMRKKGYVPTTTTCEQLAAPLFQIENNGAISAASWSDGHIEVFARTKSGRAVHAWTDGATNQWHPSAELGGRAECGLASAISFAGSEHALVFDSSANGGDTTSSYFSSGWKALTDFGGRDLLQISALRWNDLKTGGWNDGRVEVFGLAAGDHHIYHKYYDPQHKRWNGWTSLGGGLATGVSPILNHTGDAVLFALDPSGQPWFDQSRRSTGDGWDGWKRIDSREKLSSRPVAVRDPNGDLRVFARGQDGKLYLSSSTRQGFSPFELVDESFGFAGEPSASVDDGNVEVFVRGDSGKISVAAMNMRTHKMGRFERIGNDLVDSDPFAWARPDGRVELFAVGDKGHLIASYHGKHGWTAFETIATGVDSCVTPQLQPECPKGAGTYCGGHGIAGSPDTLYACMAGKLTAIQSCASGCDDQGAGGSDTCTTPTGGGGSGGGLGGGVCSDGTYCGGDGVSGPSNSLYFCIDGSFTGTQGVQCPYGCTVNHGGHDCCAGQNGDGCL